MVTTRRWEEQGGCVCLLEAEEELNHEANKLIL